jgi:CheY-like chemotaxis protein
VLNLCQDRVEQSKKDRADKEDGTGTSAHHRPSEAEPDTERDQHGNAEDGQNVEDMDGPPSVSGNKPPAKKVSRLSSGSNAEHHKEKGNNQNGSGYEHPNKAGQAENHESDQSPEDSVPQPPFTKPLVLSRNPADAALSREHTPQERILHGLCVDDNKINLRLLVTLMRKEKHTYEQSENGQEALDVFKASNCTEPPSDDSRKPFDFVLMDIGMPVMDGITCTKAIREHERKHGLTPTYIVACTAWGDGQTQREAKEAGMDAFLPKPLKFAHLKELLSGLTKHE